MDFFKGKVKNKEKSNTAEKKNKKAKQETLTVQDIIKYDEITDKGIIRVGDTYTVVMETDQTNSSLLDYQENARLWSNFRVMLNSINIRYSMILQSHFFDVNDFVNDYDDKASSLMNLTPQLTEAKNDVIKGYRKFTEERNRDQRSYYIFRYNPDKEGIETGFQTGNATIDELFKKAKSTAAELDDEESRSLALSVLDEVTELAYQLLHKLHIRSVRLNRLGVLNMIYSTLNRDLTTSQRLHDVSEAHSFSEIKVSESPQLFAEVLDAIEEDDVQLFIDYDLNNQLLDVEEQAQINEDLSSESEVETVV